MEHEGDGVEQVHQSTPASNGTPMIWSKRIQITAEMATPIAAWRQNACRVPKKNAKPRKKSTTLIRNPPTAPHAVATTITLKARATRAARSLGPSDRGACTP